MRNFQLAQENNFYLYNSLAVLIETMMDVLKGGTPPPDLSNKMVSAIGGLLIISIIQTLLASSPTPFLKYSNRPSVGTVTLLPDPATHPSQVHTSHTHTHTLSSTTVLRAAYFWFKETPAVIYLPIHRQYTMHSPELRS